MVLIVGSVYLLSVLVVGLVYVPAVSLRQGLLSRREACAGTVLWVFPLSLLNVYSPKAGLCCVKGCKNRKKYSHSQLKLPLCSLECYKKLNCCSKVSEVIKSGFYQDVTK